jgi:hypothetical protein
VSQKINRFVVVLFLVNFVLYGCATRFQPVKDDGPTNPMLLGGKSDVMKFPVSMDYTQMNIHNPKLRSIIRVAKQSSTATVVILYPPEYLKQAEKIYSVINQANVKVARPIQSAIVSGGVSDNQNIYVYVTFTPILIPQNVQESMSVNY